MFQCKSSGVRSSQYLPTTESQRAYSMVCGTILGAPVVPDVKKICIRSEFLLLLGSSDPARCAFWASWVINYIDVMKFHDSTLVVASKLTNTFYDYTLYSESGTVTVGQY